MGLKKLLIFIFVFGGLYSPAQDTPFKADSLMVSWKLLKNQHGDSGFQCKLTFTNNGRAAVPATEWKIYFNLRYHGRQLKSLSPAFTIRFVSGDLFYIQPTQSFTGLSENEGVSLVFTGIRRIANYQDIPSGFFWVSDREPKKGVALADVIIQRPDTTASSSEHLPHYDVTTFFEANARIKDIPLEELPKIFPTPQQYQALAGNFILDKNTAIISDNQFRSEALYLSQEIHNLTGSIPKLNDNSSHHRILLSYETNANPEAYKLEINPNQIVIRAGSATGIFYGIQSLKSALPAGAWLGKNGTVSIPCLRVSDAPLFPVREFMLDVARNFQPKNEILRVLDLMALYKLNVFHFHLTDDEGWRIAIPGLPELTETGAKRGFPFNENQQLHPSYGSGPDGSLSAGSGFYSTEEFVEILKYAAERHILVIPEIESPGHARAAIKAMDNRYKKYMQLRDTAVAVQYLLTEPADGSVYMSNQGFNDDIMNPAMPSTFRFMEKVIDELDLMYKSADIPLVVVHVGGDEVAHGAWEKSPSVIQWIKEDPNRNTKHVWNAYFGQLKNTLKTRGISMTGWEELVIGTQDSSEIRKIMVNESFIKEKLRMESWWNQYGNEDMAYKIANAGYPVVLSFVDYFYFDLAHNKSFDEPGDGWVGYIDLQKVFSFLPYNYYRNNRIDINGDPQPAGLFSSKVALNQTGMENIKGIQCALWGENLVTPELLEYLLLPRLLAMAERAWAKEPNWSKHNDPALFEAEYNKDWSVFANVLGKKELPKLDFYHGGYGYRIPFAVATVQNGNVVANAELPGFKIHYTTDGSIPDINSPLYTSPLPEKGNYKFRAFDTRGRGGPPTVNPYTFIY